MNLDETDTSLVESRRDICYNKQSTQDLDELMYDDYDLDYTFAQDYSLDEDTFYEYYAQLDVQDLDEEYTRDARDYDTLAYRHYA